MEFRGGRTGGGKLGGLWRGRRAEQRVRRATMRLGLERLEERVVLSTWSGADAIAKNNDNWSDAANWDTPPTTGSDLVFKAGLPAAALTTNDNIQDGSFGSLTIQDIGYSIASTEGFGVTLSGAIDAEQTSGSSTLNLPVSFATEGTVTVDNAQATLLMGQPIAGSAGLAKQGPGVFETSATNTYIGGTVVAAGTMLVNGSVLDNVSVSSGATLGGTGTVGLIVTNGAAIVGPGNASTTGILTDSGALTLDSTADLAVDINGTTVGTNYDQLSVGGAINLANASLTVSTGSFTPTPGQQFIIVNNTSGSAITGTFAGLAEGATLTVGGNDFAISYKGGPNGEDVVLTSIPASTFTWSGADASASTPNDNWSDPNNWVGGVAPTSEAGDSLYFPTGLTGAALNSNDDISGGSFASLIIGDTGYTIASTQGYGVTLSGTIDASQASGSSTLSLPVAFGTTAGTVMVDNTAAALAMGGVVTGSAGLTKQGSGVLDLSGTNTYTGDTTVAAGNLLVDGTVDPVVVSSGATLGGVGTVGSIATTAATVSPGDSSTLTGILTDSGALTLDSSSNFDVTINGTSVGTQYDQLAAGGVVNLANATLNVSTGSFIPVAGQAFIIVNNTSGSAVTGTFAGLVEGATVTADGHDFSISYKGGSNGQDVVLTPITPPTVTWSGTAAIGTSPNDNWSDPTNWVGGAAPAAGDSVIFPLGPTGAALTSTNDIANTIFNSITIQTSGYTIQGDGVGLAGTIDSSQSTGSSTISLPITFNPGVGTTTVDNSGATLLLSGVVTASGGMTKQGQGTLNLVANDGSLAAAIDAGTLLVDGTAGDISANTGTTIGGSGTVAGITTTSGTVSPGDSATATGILTDTGNLVFSGSSTFAAELNGTTAGTGYDQLVAGGTGGNIDINGTTLSVTLGSAFPTGGGQQYTILHNTATSPINGTFTGLAQGATLTLTSGQSFSISYTGGTDGRDVVLTSLLSTTTTLSPVSGTHVTGQSVTLTATVTPGSGTGTPTGSIEFESGSTDLGSVPLTSGNATATLETTKLTAGTNTITAVYSGDSTFATSTSQALAVVVAQASTTTTVTSNLNPSVAGQPVTLTATVSPVSPGTGSPTGTVIFSNGSTQIGTETISDGVATLTTTTLPVGTDSITAVYSSDSNYTVSTSAALNQVVTSGTSSVTASASNTNPFALQSITLTAIVAGVTGLGTPTGTVTFFTGTGIKLGSGTLSSGATSITTGAAALPSGAQMITAVYSGDSNFQGATSSPVRVVVGSQTDLFVNQVYQDVLGVPAIYSATYWTALINGGYPPKTVATRILKSGQASIVAVQRVYESLLGRAPTPKEIKRGLASGSLPTRAVSIDVFGSKEFYVTQGKGTTDGFLNALAVDWFGVPFPPSTQARLARQISHGVSRHQIARQVLTGPSGVKAQVNSIIEAVLERPATAKDDKQFAPLVSQGNLVPVYATLFASKEFKTKFVDIG